jgi:RimJ/RimL family protein N-acetyltransferase
MDDGELRRRVNLNLIDSSRRLFELDTGATVEADESGVFGAGRHDHPLISNAAFRADDAADADEFVSRASAFFAPRRRRFCIWVRGDEPEDADLAAAAERAGFASVYEMPEMTCDVRVAEREPADGAELRRITSPAEVADFWAIMAESYVSLDFPPELFALYDDHDRFLADDVAAFIAHLEEKPVSAAMTIVSHGVAGIYWVGTLDEARGKGLAWATTAAATNAGFELGADVASLQASRLGEPIYRRMGYETLFPYRLFLAPVPG